MVAFLLMYPYRTIVDCPKHVSKKKYRSVFVSLPASSLSTAGCFVRVFGLFEGLCWPGGMKQADKQQAVLFFLRLQMLLTSHLKSVYFGKNTLSEVG